MAQKIASNYRPLFDALHAALGVDLDNTRRVVIDIQSGRTPVVWVELFGDENLINVVESLGSIDIERK